MPLHGGTITIQITRIVRSTICRPKSSRADRRSNLTSPSFLERPRYNNRGKTPAQSGYQPPRIKNKAQGGSNLNRRFPSKVGQISPGVNINKLADQLKAASPCCEVALEPTGDYHRPLANFLVRRGHNVQFVSSIATHRTREALFNSWDKNDPKDAQVILHLLKGGVTQRYADPLQSGYQDLQELLGTYRQVVGRKTRVYHSLMTHYLPLYFPEAEPFLGSSRSEWFLDVFIFAPCPAEVLKYSKAMFLRKTVKGDEGHPTVRRRLVAEFYETARESVGIPIKAGSIAMRMFRTILEEYISLAKLRRQLEKQIHEHLESNADYQHLRTIPGIGPIVGLTILSEAGDLRRFSHYDRVPRSGVRATLDAGWFSAGDDR